MLSILTSRPPDDMSIILSSVLELVKVQPALPCCVSARVFPTLNPPLASVQYPGLPLPGSGARQPGLLLGLGHNNQNRSVICQPSSISLHAN